MASVVLPVVHLVVGACLAVLALMLLRVTMSSRLNRAFATFLAASAVFSAAKGLASLVRGTRVAPGFEAAVWHAQLAVLPALLLVAVAYFATAQSTKGRVASLLVAALAVGLQVAYALDHCVAECAAGAGLAAGPLNVVPGATTLVLGAMALLLAIDVVRRPGSMRAHGAFLVACAFVLTASFEGSAQLWKLVLRDAADVVPRFADGQAWVLSNFILAAAALLPALGATAFLLALGRRQAAWRRAGWLAVGALATGLLVGLYTEFGSGTLSGWVLDVKYAVVGLVRVAVFALMAFAVVRHRLFGRDDTARTVIRKGTLAALFLAVLLVVANVAQNFLGELYGALLGGLATGVLLFALYPLQRFAEKVAEAAVPKLGASGGNAERLMLYRDQAQVVWMDGKMGKKERLLLDQLRTRLGIPAEEASRLEHEAALMAAPRRSARSPRLS